MVQNTHMSVSFYVCLEKTNFLLNKIPSDSINFVFRGPGKTSFYFTDYQVIGTAIAVQ